MHLSLTTFEMVSKKIFESVEFLCRKLRGHSIFGGFRLWFVGTFISFHLLNDKGDYSFESAVFKQLF